MTQESTPAPLVDSVLLIDGDNDPHFPPDFTITDRTLVRVFLRPGAKMPRGLEKRVGALPHCVTVLSVKGGANAADFVMSLHAGILHATLPMHLPFTIVTNDKSLGVMTQEIQRVGRQVALWSSHPEGGGRRQSAAAKPAGSSGSSRRRRSSGRGRGRGRSAPPPAPVSEAPHVPEAEALEPNVTEPAPRAGGKSLAAVAASYGLRLARIKDPPSRLKTLLNDIKNRTVASGFTPEQILEELKRSGALLVNEQGRVQRVGG